MARGEGGLFHILCPSHKGEEAEETQNSGTSTQSLSTHWGGHEPSGDADNYRVSGLGQSLVEQ